MTSRVIALTAYTSIYGYWVIIVVAFHWSSMLVWLLASSSDSCYGENKPARRKFFIKLLVSIIYIIAYINLQESNHKQKMVSY